MYYVLHVLFIRSVDVLAWSALDPAGVDVFDSKGSLVVSALNLSGRSAVDVVQ